MQAVLISIALGMAAVLQGGMNRVISVKFGLTTAVLVNSSLVLIYAFAAWLYTYRVGLFNGYKFAWWHTIPAVCGILFVLGVPWCIAQIGALRVFLCLVVGQMALSLAWDYYFEQISIDAFRVAGAGLAIAGLLVANWRG